MKPLIQPKPIFPPYYRPPNYFSVDEEIFLIQLKGNIERVKVQSILKTSINYVKIEDEKVLAHAIRSPLLISSIEFTWVQQLLQKYTEAGAIDVIKRMTKDAQQGDHNSIIYLGHLTLIERIHGSNAMYSQSFPHNLAISILTTAN
ncbi:hypothetical protein H7Y21_01585 [Arenimonas sp.]|nr:hypothetical protein [Candidatus Parcubacteria bacterium]